VDKNALTLLLDGLDEAPIERRSACIDAINDYRRSHGPANLVVCSRRIEYEEQPHRLKLDNAVILQHLDHDQVKQYLSGYDQDGVVARFLNQDTTLKQFARSPLMLNIMLLASQEVSVQDWRHLGKVSAHRERLFDVYINYVFSRRAPTQTQLKGQILRVLPWLARNMFERGQTVFLIEDLDPAWLKTSRQRLVWKFALHFIIACLLALTIGLIYLVSGAPSQYVPRMA